MLGKVAWKGVYIHINPRETFMFHVFFFFNGVRVHDLGFNFLSIILTKLFKYLLLKNSMIIGADDGINKKDLSRKKHMEPLACSMVNGIGCIALSVQGSKFVVL